MGKGDKRSRKGKIWRGSYGNTRKKKDSKPAYIPKPKAKKEPAPVQAENAETEVKVAKPKKAAVKKPKAEGEKKAAPKKKAAENKVEDKKEE